jgi:hypothetical protein
LRILNLDNPIDASLVRIVKVAEFGVNLTIFLDLVGKMVRKKSRRIAIMTVIKVNLNYIGFQ